MNDAESNKRPWPQIQEHMKEMSLSDLIQRMKELNNIESQILWEIETTENNDNRRKIINLRGKKLDVSRLRKSLSEYIRMHEDMKTQKNNMILAEDSPVDSRDKPGYVYIGRLKDQELWIKDNQTQSVAIEKLAS